MSFATTPETMPQGEIPTLSPERMQELWKKFAYMPLDQFEKVRAQMSPVMQRIFNPKSLKKYQQEDPTIGEAIFTADEEKKGVLASVLEKVKETLGTMSEKIWEGMKWAATLPIEMMKKFPLTTISFLVVAIAYFGAPALLSLLKIAPEAAFANAMTAISKVLPFVTPNFLSSIRPEAIEIMSANPLGIPM